MKLGFGLYRNMLSPADVRFAKQVGATHIVAHMPAMNSAATEQLKATYGEAAIGFGVIDPDDAMWTYEGLRDLRAMINAEGLELEALENFSLAHWYDILLDGPRKKEQQETLKQVIGNVGRAGIPIIGYNFSVAAVWGRDMQPYGRGGAMAVGFNDPPETPIPIGLAWNMVYDVEKFDPTRFLPPVSWAEIRQRYVEFLEVMIPVAEESGVRLAIHPDDPPMPALRGAHRLIHSPETYAQILDLNPSPANALEMCIGTLGEMPGDHIYETVDRLSKTGRIGYIHFRNVRGAVPHYEEVFLDEGHMDMIRLLDILHQNGYNGVLIPDHTPATECAAPWHAGMAFAMGYIKAALTMVEAGR